MSNLFIFIAGIPLSGGIIDFILVAEQLAQITCSGNEISVSSCTIRSIAVSSFQQQARVRCFQERKCSYSYNVLRRQF